MNPANGQSILPALRRAGLIVFLYAFTHSYFGVGSLKNALTGPVAGPFRGLALTYGLGWAALLAAGLLLIAGRRRGIVVARAGACAVAASQAAGIVISWPSMLGNASTLPFELAHPVYPVFLCLLLPGFCQKNGKTFPSLRPSRALAALALGALLPWLSLLSAGMLADGHLPAHPPLGLSIALFMTVWSLLPFGVLVLTDGVFPKPGAFRGGLAGTAAAGLFVYSLLWLQNFNKFLMALLPPVVFAGQAAGVLIGIIITRMASRRGETTA
jgi:hypothetical protein